MDVFDSAVLDVLNLSIDGVFIENLKGDILMANHAGAYMLGYTIEEITKLNISDFVPDEEKYYLQEEYKEDDLFSNEYIVRMIIKKDGTLIRTEINSKIVVSKGVEYLIAYIRDASDVPHYDPRSQNNTIEAISKKNTIQIYNSRGILKCEVLLNNILYVESKRNKLFYHLIQGKLIDGYGTMNSVEQFLKSENNFLRCYQSYIINMDYAQFNDQGHNFIMDGINTVLIKKRDYKKIKNIFVNYNLNK